MTVPGVKPSSIQLPAERWIESGLRLTTPTSLPLADSSVSASVWTRVKHQIAHLGQPVLPVVVGRAGHSEGLTGANPSSSQLPKSRVIRSGAVLFWFAKESVG